jgi:ATP-dependent Clp protease ATP-binding subunit ClpX
MKAGSRLSCSFCAASQRDVKRLIANPTEDSYICEECVAQCAAILADTPVVEKPKPSPAASPRSIKTFLDRYVIGQDTAKEILSVAVYNHYKRLATPVIDGVEIDKSNILLYGPTGVGKTLLVQSIARMLDVPLAIADATALTEAGYVGDDVENIIGRLLHAADHDVKRAERGIIFLDEIDKKRSRATSTTSQHDATGEGVQQALLTLLEGSDLMVPVGPRRGPNSDMVKVNTRNILFILGGAFNGLDRIVAQSLNDASTIGFGAKIDMATDRLLHKVQPEHLIKYGMIPELVGRIPIITALDDLDEAQLVRVLTEPKNAIVQQYIKMFAQDGIQLEFKEDALRAVAALARARKTNGRALRGVLETCLTKLQYNLPDLRDQGVERVIIHAATITDGTEPEVTYVVRKGKLKL